MTSDPSGASIRPQNIHADRPVRTLTIEWADGHRSSFDFRPLRWLCPCAFCRGEAGEPGWLDSDPTLTDEQVELSDITLVGHYALQPFWADGHSSGFYTFAHLRRSCPCAADTERREAAASSGSQASTGSHGSPAHSHG
jgi:DUF971 family protein